MKFFKRILKYSVYIFIAAWMFIVGIIVGRGNSPVNFDTHQFQKRLETIAREFGKSKKTPDKINLGFYETLGREDHDDNAVSVKGNQEKNIAGKDAVDTDSGSVPLKTSRKKQTFSDQAAVTSAKKIQQIKKHASDDSKQNTAPELLKDQYIVQIASYKRVKDAVVQINALKAKGFSSYMVKGQKDGAYWHRVRSGPFASLDEAGRFKKQLEKIKINSIIIKSEKR